MFLALRKGFSCSGMKKRVAEYLAKCLKCQQVKVEHEQHDGLLNSLHIPEWKWESISLDFIIGLLRPRRNHEYVMAVVENLSKEAHIIPIRSTSGTM